MPEVIRKLMTLQNLKGSQGVEKSSTSCNHAVFANVNSCKRVLDLIESKMTFIREGLLGLTSKLLRSDTAVSV